jgi:catechol 2,3-dioxygenase-like lactoylglutathione lyase family enzyme
MSMRLTHVNQWVHDQDEALAFYTEKLGMELREDVTMPELGDFRWLSVGPVGQPEVAIVLMAIPGPPVFEPETSEKIRDLLARGAASAVFLTTEDAKVDYEQLKSRGVEFTDELSERPYGIDCGFRDPAGNSVRLTQVREDL